MPRLALFMKSVSLGPNKSSRALAKPPRSLVLSAVPATIKVLPNASFLLVLS